MKRQGVASEPAMSTLARLALISGLALAGTADACFSLCTAVTLTHPPSFLPSLGAALLSALLAAPRRCGTMKALTPAPLT
ncbi:MAG: hypothetical protein HW378_4800, partial [Anaerolineales bacterium]|nr:hypothetical protein [Anaerolineales bacterium]